MTAWDPPLIQLTDWPPKRLDFSRYQGDIKRFLADTASEPTVASSTFVRDRDGNDWVVLESYVKKVDPLAHKGWRGLQERSAVHTLLIRASDARAFLAALGNEPRREIRDLHDFHGHTDCCYVGEVGRIGPTCYHGHDKFREVDLGGKSFQVVATVENYAWEGSIFDCSIGETASAVLPSTFIQQAAGLAFDMRGPSWLNAAGAPVFTYYEEEGNDSHALLVQAPFLRRFLAEHKLELIVLHWFERMRLSDDYSGKHPYVEASVDVRLTTELVICEGKVRRTEHNVAETEV